MIAKGSRVRIAIVGCGYVADFYVRTLANHAQLELVGVADRDGERARAFSDYHGLRRFPTTEELLRDPSVEIVVNLTNPRSHYEVTKAALEAGKHVYSEKPLAMDLAQAEELVALAEERGRALGGAPCSILGESAQTLWKALRAGTIGRVRLAYAELDEGLIHRMAYRGWRSESGAPWPYRDEFEVGATMEHAGYYLTWLVAFFGPARRVTSFSTALVPDKAPDVRAAIETPDLSIAAIEFDSGTVARLTSSIVAPHDHSLRIFGDDGTLAIDDCWNYGSPVRLRRRTPLALRLERRPWLARLLRRGPRAIPLVRTPEFRDPRRRFPWRTTNRMDFARGVAELADAVSEGRTSRLSARFALHVNEIALAMQHPERLGSPRELTTSCEPMEPMPWGR